MDMKPKDYDRDQLAGVRRKLKGRIIYNEKIYFYYFDFNYLESIGITRNNLSPPLLYQNFFRLSNQQERELDNVRFRYYWLFPVYGATGAAGADAGAARPRARR